MNAFILFVLSACGRGDLEADRAPGARAPLTADCDPVDPTACLLPWPSSRYTVADPDSETGLRLAIQASSLEAEDDPSDLNSFDGFSPISGIATGFSARLDEATLADALLLLVAEPSSPRYGESVPLVVERVMSGSALSPRDLLIGRPRWPMPPNAEHIGLVLRSLATEDGSALAVDHLTAVALLLEEPADEDEATYARYHAPTRSLLAQVGIDPSEVLRLWDFTTASATSPARRLGVMKEAAEEALADGQIQVVFDRVRTDVSADIAVVAQGRLTGVPSFLREDGLLNLDADGLPSPTGQTREAPFRVLIPAGEGDWPVALYGHGTGGDVDDDTLDAMFGTAGVAKVGLAWQGWTSSTLIYTLARAASATLSGTAASTAGLISSVSDASLVLSSLEGSLGEALAAEQIDGQPNPAAGRHPSLREPVWIGGSMGGTMGAVVTLSEDRVRYGALNVPGGGWTHFIASSDLYETLRDAVVYTYGGELEAALAMIQSQGAWDEIDGAAWAGGVDGGDLFLLQESIGDPILPNIGTEILAASLGAALILPEIVPIPTLAQGSSPWTGASGLTQYEVPNTGVYDVHGFAGRDTPASEAAQQQIAGFLLSALEGEPTITHPSGCDALGADGACDFSEAW